MVALIRNADPDAFSNLSLQGQVPLLYDGII